MSETEPVMGEREAEIREALNDPWHDDRDPIDDIRWLLARVATLTEALRELAGSDPEGFDGHHYVGDEKNAMSALTPDERCMVLTTELAQAQAEVAALRAELTEAKAEHTAVQEKYAKELARYYHKNRALRADRDTLAEALRYYAGLPDGWGQRAQDTLNKFGPRDTNDPDLSGASAEGNDADTGADSTAALAVPSEKEAP